MFMPGCLAFCLNVFVCVCRVFALFMRFSGFRRALVFYAGEIVYGDKSCVCDWLTAHRGCSLVIRLSTSAVFGVTRHACFSPSSPILLSHFHQFLLSLSFLGFLFSQPPQKCRRHLPVFWLLRSQIPQTEMRFCRHKRGLRYKYLVYEYEVWHTKNETVSVTISVWQI